MATMAMAAVNDQYSIASCFRVIKPALPQFEFDSAPHNPFADTRQQQEKEKEDKQDHI